MLHAAVLVMLSLGLYQPPSEGFHLEFVGTHACGWFNQSGSEIAAYHVRSRRLFVLNGAVGLDVLDISNPETPTRTAQFRKFGPNSVAVHGDLVAVAFAPKAKDARGEVVFMTVDGVELSRVRVGFGPDMLAFTPDGNTLLVANEGEADDQLTIDPEGSISVVDMTSGPEHAVVRDAGFGEFESARAALQAQGVHLPVPGHTLAQQFEPEYIAITPDGRTAFVTIQEANAVAELDIATRRVTNVLPLGLKDFSRCGLDASDKDGRADIVAWPVLGLRQPDAIAVWQQGADTFFAIAEEGESRDAPGYRETDVVGRLTLDTAAFPMRESHEEGWSRTDLVKRDMLGRLEVSVPACDTDGDGDADRLVAFGGRGLSVWRVQPNGTAPRATLAWDSGSIIERVTSERMPKAFNACNDASPSRDARSRTKGPEPEGIATMLLDGRRLLFVGLEQPGGVVVFDATNPETPQLLDWANRRDPAVDLDIDEDRDGNPDHMVRAGDLGPEGLLAIPPEASPDGTALLVVCNEVSGTTTIWRVVRGASPSVTPARGL